MRRIIFLLLIAMSSNAYAGSAWVDEKRDNDYRNVEDLYYRARRIAVVLENELNETRNNNKELLIKLDKQAKKIKKLELELDKITTQCIEKEGTGEIKKLIISTVEKKAEEVAKSTATEIAKKEVKKVVNKE